MLMVIFISVFDYRWVVECEYLFNIKHQYGKNPWEVLYFSGMILCALRENIFGEKRENEDLLQREIWRD